MAEGYTSITITISGEEAEKVKASIDDSDPYNPNYGLVSTFANKSNWKSLYLVDFFYEKGYYELFLRKEKYANQKEYDMYHDHYVDGFYDINRIDKDKYFQWYGKNYLYTGQDTDWIEFNKFYTGEYVPYLWNEENKTLVYVTKLNPNGLSLRGVDYNDMIKAFNKIDKLLKSWKLEKLTDYQRISKVCSYICKNVSYGRREGIDSQSGAEALLYGVSVCGGYAHLTDYFLKAMGYPSAYVSGNPKSGGEGHAWNVVKIGGKWYGIDNTWNDDPGCNRKYLLASKKGMRDHEIFCVESNASEYKLADKPLSSSSKSKIKLAYE
jgi:hypothetical protein